MTKAASLPPITSLTVCPHCGGDEYVVRVQYRGSGAVRTSFDGTSGFDNSGMYDDLVAVPGKVAYCGDCGRAIGYNDRQHGPA